MNFWIVSVKKVCEVSVNYRERSSWIVAAKPRSFANSALSVDPKNLSFYGTQWGFSKATNSVEGTKSICMFNKDVWISIDNFGKGGTTACIDQLLTLGGGSLVLTVKKVPHSS